MFLLKFALIYWIIAYHSSMRFISKLSTKSLPASLTVLLNHANFSLELSNLASSRSMSCQSSWLTTGFPLAVFQSRFFQLFIQAGPSFVSLTDLITYWEFKTNSKGCWVRPNCSSFFKLSRKAVISISLLVAPKRPALSASCLPCRKLGEMAWWATASLL